MRYFSARETEWLLTLDGIELASFWRRALALTLDIALIAAVLLFGIFFSAMAYAKLLEHQGHHLGHLKVSLSFDKFDVESDDPTFNKHVDDERVRVFTELLVPVLYFGTFTWLGKGRTLGKWLFRIRVVSIVRPHLTFWHSVERALGYGAAALEFGFGFVQFFIHPYRRCAQDRLAETIVVTERGYRAMRHKLSHRSASEPELEPSS
jgi:hypothetical protein